MKMEKTMILVSDNLNTKKNELEGDLEFAINEDIKPSLKSNKIVKLLEKISVVSKSQEMWNNYINDMVELEKEINGNSK